MRPRFAKVTLRWLTVFSIVLMVVTFAGFTVCQLQPMPKDLNQHIGTVTRNTYVDRVGRALNVTYENEWNLSDRLSIHDLPPILQQAFVLSEDKRFFEHSGVDWLARLHAIKQNVFAGNVVRGASTISEQVARMINPRPRNLMSRWLEGFEAMALEEKHSKLDILEFYINQVPYKARRRGVAQAAHYYFDRDVNTLNEKEMLALAVLVRSPRWLDPETQIENLDRSVIDLARRMQHQELLIEPYENIVRKKLAVNRSHKTYNVQHFLAFANQQTTALDRVGHSIYTTIDLELQNKTQRILDNRLRRLKHRQVGNGAALIVEHETNRILSWAVGYAGQKDEAFNQMDAVRAKRQPGSALKPLLYTNALLHGWTAATQLADSPLDEGVGLGMHSYHNYSRAHYGNISVREALGNSLNIPAVRAIQFVGTDRFLSFLRDLGINSLSQHPNVYGDGLALGNGELTLLELVEAYTVLARMGDHKPLTALEGEHQQRNNRRIFSEDVASLIADIMSDPAAREKEFGWNSILNFPHQTAVKTGTSSDYRDAWAIGFNDKYTIGVWMGNMDYLPMHEVTGATGPALALRSIFNELNQNRDARALYLSNNLVKHRICIETGLLAVSACESRDEWFVSGIGPTTSPIPVDGVRLQKPSKGLLLAMDPRIPDDHEYFEFTLSEMENIERVRWFVNNKLAATTKMPHYHWKLSRGKFSAYAEVFLMKDDRPVTTRAVEYQVN